MTLIEAFLKVFFWIFTRALAFVLLNWVLLGLPPAETLNTSYVNIKGLIYNSQLFSESFREAVDRFAENQDPVGRFIKNTQPEAKATVPQKQEFYEINNIQE